MELSGEQTDGFLAGSLFTFIGTLLAEVVQRTEYVLQVYFPIWPEQMGNYPANQGIDIFSGGLVAHGAVIRQSSGFWIITVIVSIL
ncbi:hypothetical protein TH59_10580 [Pantoea ananatis]|uniref:hypothetical protein n=1 Tax=Pantoea TaxID=53335 RepID=UPI0002F8475A|nr:MULTISPECIES: hypothetical protein [Pantoea]ERM14956.1 hypothetical protein L585_06450 [Pantoea ananatis BRT175]ASN17670.1 hypothetical protein B7764_21765 [Pantoea ananatis]AVG74525.1 hypothetical protein B9Q16_00205 [Pantoea ananatis]MDC7865648.1 hypothetical protein [Pantoea ananatis]PQK72519.1 hypothetical protein CG430_19325 [Pantoea ananatis]